MSEKNDEKQSEIAKRHSSVLSYHYDIQDAFCDFLETGNLDKEEISRALKDLDDLVKTGNKRKALSQWTEAVFWHADRTAEDLEAEAESLVPYAHLLRPHEAQQFIDGLKEIRANAISDKFKKAWCDNTSALNIQHNLSIGIPANFDQDIVQTVEAINNAANPPPTLEESLGRVMSSGGWGPEHELAINKQTQQDWEEFIKEDKGGKRLTLVRRLFVQPSERTAAGMAAARSACDSLVHKDPSSRLAKVLKLRGLATK